MRRSLVPLFLLVSLGSADAQNFVSGVIRDEFGGSVSGARVRLESISGAFNQAIVTGEDGRFRFETGRTGRALLTIESPAFERHVKEIATEQRENEDLDIVLSIRTIPQQISVTASGYLEDLDEAARATTVIGRSELDKLSSSRSLNRCVKCRACASRRQEVRGALPIFEFVDFDRKTRQY